MACCKKFYYPKDEKDEPNKNEGGCKREDKPKIVKRRRGKKVN